MKKGFTLVELLVVMAIMGILVVITVSQFNTARMKARDVQRKGDLNALSKALQMYYTDYGIFPTASSNGKIEIGGSEIDWGGEFVDGSYVYMKVIPQENSRSDDFPYCYKTADSNKKMALFAMLENTDDSECSNVGGVGTYSCEGTTYCYGIASPNTSLSEVSAF